MPRGIHMTGRKLSEETKSKMSLTHKKLHSGNRLPKPPKGERPKWLNGETAKKAGETNKRQWEDKTKHPRWKGGKPKCKVCGKQLWSYKSQYCISHVPRGGANNNSWKGGLTSTRKLERNRFNKELQKLVFERDNYSCQKCGKRGGYLHVNHKKPWSEYPELRFDLNNCETLCVACHYLKTYNKPMPLNVVWGQTRLGGLIYA